METTNSKEKRKQTDLFYKGLKGKSNIPIQQLQPLGRGGRKNHSMAFRIPYANTDVYKYSFFPNTIREWNALPTSLITAAESANDNVKAFKTLIRGEDYY